jgi:hypothetical protein
MAAMTENQTKLFAKSLNQKRLRYVRTVMQILQHYFKLEAAEEHRLNPAQRPYRHSVSAYRGGTSS